MRARSVVLLALIGCTPVDAPDSPTPSKAPPVIVEPSPVTCLARFQLDSHASVLDEQRRRGGAQRWNDFARRYPAATIDPASHHAVELVAGRTLGGAPLLWFTPDFADAVVDAAIFSELKFVDATTLRGAQQVEIGTLTERGHAELRKRELLEFLLEAGVIQTFAHIGSSLCLRSEVEDQRGYRAELDGTHEYYTNQENHDPIGFALEITPDRVMTVTGTLSPS
jgi:hypothetical protein